MIKVITFGTFDVFHVGHLRLLERARSLGDRLAVGVSTDELNFRKKERLPVFPHYAALTRCSTRSRWNASAIT
jgi:cytidyltransferase-like protein